jgi:hypothetical protein
MRHARVPRVITVLCTTAALLAGVSVAAVSHSSPASAETRVPGSFTPLTPARLLDTRGGNGTIRAGAVGPNRGIALQVAGRGGVPASAVGAVVLNVTVTGPSVGGFLTVYPDGTPRPVASNLNFAKGQTIANLVTVRLGADGRVQLFNSSGGTVQLVADVSGWYQAGPASRAGTFGPLAPARLLDTRTGNGFTRAGALRSSEGVSLQVTGRAGVPAGGVAAVVLNVTETAATAAGYVRLGAGSVLNFVKGQTIANSVTVSVGPTGRLSFDNASGGTLHLIIDVAGYYLTGTKLNGDTSPEDAGGYQPGAYIRFLDTRGGPPVPANQSITLQVTHRSGVPIENPLAVILNVTVVSPTRSGFLTVYPVGTSRPTASNLNFAKAQIIPNAVVVTPGTDGKVVLFNSSGGTVHVVVDSVGYFLADTPTPQPGPSTVRGRITMADSGTPVTNAPVTVYLGSRLKTGKTTLGTAVGQTRTTVDGTYSISGLIPGPPNGFIVCVNASAVIGTSLLGYQSQCNGGTWDGGPQAAPFVFVYPGSDGTAVLDMALTPPYPRPGTLSGKITAAADGSALPDAYVDIFDQDDNLVDQVVPDLDGTWVSADLPSTATPTQQLRICIADDPDPDNPSVAAPDGYTAQCYQGISWNEDDDPSTLVGTTLIAVPNGADRPGIDAALVAAP